MPKPKDSPPFAGFPAPRYTPTPDLLFDELLPDLSGAELKVLLYIIRRTFGWKKDTDAIGIKQMMSGIVTRDGKQLDRGTGLGRSTVLAAVKSLEEWGLIVRVENSHPERGDLPSSYQLVMGSGRMDPPVQQDGPPTRGSLDPPRSTVVDPQETVSQETVQEDGPIRVKDASFWVPGSGGGSLGRR